MRITPLLLSAAVLLAGWPLVARTYAIPGALVSVALAVALSFSVSGGASALAAAAGALGAFGAGVVSPGPTALGGALLVAAAYAERTLRIRGRRAAQIHVATAAFTGAAAGALIASFDAAPLSIRAVAITVAAVLVTLPCIIEADDRIAHALAAAAIEVDSPARGALLAGADLRRNADDALLDRGTSKTVRSTWRALVRLAEARLRVERGRSQRSPGEPSTADAVVGMLDGRIASHVTALARAYAGVDAVRAAELGLDDAALRTAESAGDALEQVSRAMVDVEGVATSGETPGAPL
ncbi:MAG TPA: hypothetical protein VGI39_04010 [Polyangiaceae bacterium]|jgi:hypothetical protein